MCANSHYNIVQVCALCQKLVLQYVAVSLVFNYVVFVSCVGLCLWDEEYGRQPCMQN